MKKTIFKFILILAFGLQIQSACSQTVPNFVWERSIDSGYSTSLLHVTNSQEILASSNVNFSNLLVRLSNKGDTLWSLAYGSYIMGDTTAVDTRYIDEFEGKVRMLGFRLWDVFFGAGWLLKWEINSIGMLEKSCCGAKIAQPTCGQPRGILPDGNVGMYLAGTVTRGIQEDFDKVYFIKTDDTGKGVTKVYTDVKSDTGGALVYVRSFVRLPDGGFVLAGDISYDKAGGENDAFMLRIDSVGNKIWTKNYGTKSNEGLASAIPTNDGGFLLYCCSLHFGDGKNFYTYCIKTDSAGTIQWEKSYLESNYYTNYPFKCIQTKDNGYVLVGKAAQTTSENDGDCYILKIDNKGTKQWSYVYGSPGADDLESVAELPNGHLIIGGRNNSKMYIAEITTPVVGVENSETLVSTMSLVVSQLQSGETFVRYSNPSISQVSLTLFNSIGSKVRQFEDIENKKAGEYTIEIPANQLQAGVYFLRLSDGKTSITKPLAIIR